jgi:hypothetical protein
MNPQAKLHPSFDKASPFFGNNKALAVMSKNPSQELRGGTHH